MNKPKPITFQRSGQWWAQTIDFYGLVTGSGDTEAQAVAAWQREYAHVEQKYNTPYTPAN